MRGKILLLFFLLLIVHISSNGQQTQPIGTNKNMVKANGGLTADSIMKLPTVKKVYPWYDSTGNMAIVGGTLYFHNGTAWVAVTGSGTVTSVGSGYGLSGGPITGAGTLVVDTATLFAKIVSTFAAGYGLNLGGRTYKVDTATLATYIRSTLPPPGTGSVTNVATGYGLSGGPITSTGTVVLDTATAFTQMNVTLGVGYGLSKGGRTYKVDTATLATYIRSTIASGSGTVTNVATGYGLSGGPIATTGTVILDTATVFTQMNVTLGTGYGLSKGGRTYKVDTATLAAYIRSTIPSAGTGTVTSITFAGGLTTTAANPITSSGTAVADSTTVAFWQDSNYHRIVTGTYLASFGYAVLPSQTNKAGQMLQTNGASTLWHFPMTMGDTVSGGTANYLHYTGTGGVLAQSINMQFLPADGSLKMGVSNPSSLYLDATNSRAYIGDAFGNGNGTVIDVDDAAQSVLISRLIFANQGIDNVGNKIINLANATLSTDALPLGQAQAAFAPISVAGTVTSFSAGTLSPIFTTSVATATSTPALTFALTNAAAHTFFGNFTGSTGAPSYSSPSLASADFANQGTATTLLHGNASGNPSFGGIVTGDIVANAVTYAKIQAISGNSLLLGSSASGTAVTEITLGSGLSMSGTTLSSTGTGGTVTTFSAGTLSPLFTTSVATATSTPALTFTLTNAAAHTFFGNFTGSTGAPSYSSPLLASADFANQGTTTTLLHGNASGNPSFGAIATGDIAANAVTYGKLQAGSTNSLLIGTPSSGSAYQEITLGSGLSMSSGVLSATGTGGTVTTFSAGTLSPLFTTSVATATTTPALTFALTNAAAHTFFGNFTGSTGAPSYSSPLLASADFANQGTTTTLLHGNASGNPSFGQIVNVDIATGTIDLAAKVTGILPTANGGRNRANPTLYDIEYASSTTGFSGLAIGSANQVLTVNSGANGYQWSTPAAGTVTNVTGTTNQIDVATGTSTPVISLHSGGTLPGAWALGTPASMVGTNITGTATGLSAGTATILATTRAIYGNNFNGSADVTGVAYTSGVAMKGSTSGTLNFTPAAAITTYTWIPPTAVAASTGMVEQVYSISGTTQYTQWATPAGGGGSYTFSTGLSGSSTITADISTGVSGGQTIYGSTDNYDNGLIIRGTTQSAAQSNIWLSDPASDGSTMICTMGGGNTGLTDRWHITNAGNVVHGNGSYTMSNGNMIISAGTLTAYHVIGNTSAPTITAGAGAGTSPTVSVGSGSTDVSGYINVTTGTLPSLSSAVATITFNQAYGAAPHVTLTPANNNTSLLSGATMVFIDQATGVTTTTFIIKAGTTSLTASTAYQWWYTISQ